jgi:hypothetical protein
MSEIRKLYELKIREKVGRFYHGYVSWGIDLNDNKTLLDYVQAQLGKSTTEIATELFISATTAETHRRNIKQKLNAPTIFELSQYARAFDLI